MNLSPATRGRLYLIETWFLGLVFVVAAALKLIDVDAFSRHLAQYGLFAPGVIKPVAILVICVEAALGLCCLIGFQVKKSLWAILGLLVVFITATVFRWGALGSADCGCFGPVIAGGKEGVLWHNALLIIVAGSAILLSLKQSIKYPIRWTRLTAATPIIFIAIFFGRPASVNSLTPYGQATEDQVRIFLSATCNTCKKSVEKVAELIHSPDFPPIRVFIGAQYEQQITDFLQERVGEVSYVPMTFSQLASAAEQVPLVQILHGGKVVKEWVGEVPSTGEVMQALLEISNTLDPQKEPLPQAYFMPRTKAPKAGRFTYTCMRSFINIEPLFIYPFADAK